MVKLELKPDITDDGSSDIHQTVDHAGFSKDGLYSWIYKDSVLELIHSKTNESLAQWRFGKALNDRNTTISCVTEFEYSDGRMLLVATENLSDEGTLCLFSLSKKKVVRAIEFPRKIRAVEIIFTNTKDDVPSWVLSKHLNFFYGLAAVGTEGGYTYLVDLNLDDVMINSTTEVHPKKLSVSSPNLIDPKAKRNGVCSSDRHMAVLIDEQCHRNGQFYHRRQDDTIDKVFDEETVFVTSLKYLSQAGILAIGFNFGCFQLWRLYGPVLDYSSRFALDLKSISHFVVQEPENDPRNLVYLWIGRDSSVVGEEHGHGKVSSISLFQLCFNKKDIYDGFGIFYEDLESVCGRLEHNLTVNPYLGSHIQTTWSSQLISAYTIANPLYTPPVCLAHESFEESHHGNDLSLSMFVWRADSKQSGHNTCYWMAIFDLNRWYHAQMPHSIRCCGQAPEVCPYWAVYKLDDVVALSFPQSLLHVQVTGNNVLRFINKSPLPPEEHSFPSALEITDIQFITPQRMVRGHCYGWQGHLLQELVRDGALHLVQPANFYHQCLQARLIPQNHNEVKANCVEHQRKVLLNLSLDHNLIVELIHNCINLWADGEYVDAGCSLTLLLEWAWSTVVLIKEKVDTACQALYDCSGHILDPYTDWLIRRHHCGLVSIKQIFTIFVSQTNPTTDRGQQELEMRLEVIKLLVQHHDMVRWCLVETLLPEVKEDSTQVPGLFAYPYGELCRATRKRRAELKALKGVVTGHSLLLIDGLVKCAGPQINSIWEAEGDDSLYPPPSMQAVMNLFLLEDVLLEVKQAILLYLLQDLAAVLGCDDDHQTVVVSFVRSFNLLPSLVHTVQGLWNIDHRDYEEGLRQLVNPNVVPHSWSAWVDVAVVNTLLAQGQDATAAHYIHSGHRLGATLEDQKLNIAVLIRNRKVSPAVDYMRQCCYHKQDPRDLMPFMMRECQGNKMIGQLLQLHLLHAEEVEVENFLRDRSEPQALEPLLLYYLTHSRFVEAFTLNEEMNKMDKLEATSLAAREKAANRNRLMEAYLRVLPDITRKLLMEKQHRPAGMAGKRVEVAKPKPLSTVVYKKDQNAISRSHLIMAVMDKVEEAMKVVEDAENIDDLMAIESDKICPGYVATPLTPRHKSFTSVVRTPVAVSHAESLPSALSTNPLSTAKKELQERYTCGEEERQSFSALTKECLDLLKTPVKDSRSFISPRPSIMSSTVKTPQSILKVRRLSKTLLMSGKESWSSRKTPPSTGKHPKKMGFSASDSAIASHSSPMMELGHDKKSPTIDTSHASNAVTATPKHLRFVGISPSPSPSPLPVRKEDSFVESDVTATSSFVSEEESQEIDTNLAEEVMDVQEKELGNDAITTEEKDNRPEITSVVESEERATESLEKEIEEERSLENMETKTTVTEIVEVEEQGILSLNEGPSDRYVDDLGNLVRPDLQSPWKHNLSSEETIGTDDITLSLTHIEDQRITPAMTSSPVEEAPKTGSDVNNDVISERLEASLPQIEQEEEKINVQPKEENSTVKELLRNNLQSLVAPRKSVINTTVTTVETLEEEKCVSSHTKISHSQSLNVDTSFSVVRSLRSRGEWSPEKRASMETDSPPATPPLSKRAKMMVKNIDSKGLRETRKAKFDFATPRKSLERELRSKKTTENEEEKKNVEEIMQEIEGGPNMEKISERRSPSRSSKRKAPDNDNVIDEETLDQSLSIHTRLRKTPERRSPARTATKKDEESEVEVKKEAAKESKTGRPERQSPARSGKKKRTEMETEIESSAVEESAGEGLEQSETLQRKSPSRSVRQKTLEKGADEDDDTSVVGERLQRKSPSRSVSQKTLEKGTDDEDDTSVVESRMSTRLRSSPSRDVRSKTPERKSLSRKSPSRFVKVKTVESESDNEKHTSDEVFESGMSTRLRSSPSRDKRSKTPERKSLSRKSKPVQSLVIDEEDPLGEASQSGTGKDMKLNEQEEEEHFVPAEEFMSKMREEDMTPSSPTRRRSARLNTPDRVVNQSLQPEPGRRMSRGRAVSVSVGDTESTSNTNQPLKTDKKKPVEESSSSKKEASSLSMGRSKSPAHEVYDKKEQDTPVEDGDQYLRRSRRQSRTPERYRKDVRKLKEKLETSESESITVSPTRKSLRKAKSPERLTTDQIETVMQPLSPRRDFTLAVRASLETVAEHSPQDKGNTEDELWSEDLPPLRLEDEDDVDGGEQGKEIKKIESDKRENVSEGDKTTVEFKDFTTPTHGPSVSRRAKATFPQDSFVFSAPLTHTDEVTTSALRGKDEYPSSDTNETDKGFVFSHPTIAEDDTQNVNADVEPEKSYIKNVTTKSKRRKKALLDSPDLLPVHTAEKSSRVKNERRTRMSEIQRASANVLKRYGRRSGPVTRRLVPSSWSSDQSGGEEK